MYCGGAVKTRLERKSSRKAELFAFAPRHANVHVVQTVGRIADAQHKNAIELFVAVVGVAKILGALDAAKCAVEGANAPRQTRFNFKSALNLLQLCSSGKLDVVWNKVL